MGVECFDMVDGSKWDGRWRVHDLQGNSRGKLGMRVSVTKNSRRNKEMNIRVFRVIPDIG